MDMPEQKDVRVVSIGDDSYFVTIFDDGIGAVLGKCTVTGKQFGVSNITLEQVKLIYDADNDTELAHLPFTQEQIRLVKTGVTQQGYQKLFMNNSLIN
tara:strand:+ start:686 stop:979 length:294 start_codon:yes stop_codon:yes gene_type:complete